MGEFEARLKVPPQSSGIGEARRFTKERLNAWKLNGLVETAVLMISELVTNAILHGGEDAVLTLTFSHGKLRVEVRDSSPALPVVREYSDTATTGRGMVIVDALATEWGTFPVAGGKVVWFELAAEGSNDGARSAGEPAEYRSGGISRSGSDFKHLPSVHGGAHGGRPINKFRIPIRSGRSH